MKTGKKKAGCGHEFDGIFLLPCDHGNRNILNSCDSFCMHEKRGKERIFQIVPCLHSGYGAGGYDRSFDFILHG